MSDINDYYSVFKKESSYLPQETQSSKIIKMQESLRNMIKKEYPTHKPIVSSPEQLNLKSFNRPVYGEGYHVDPFKYNEMKLERWRNNTQGYKALDVFKRDPIAFKASTQQSNLNYIREAAQRAKENSLPYKLKNFDYTSAGKSVSKWTGQTAIDLLRETAMPATILEVSQILINAPSSNPTQANSPGQLKEIRKQEDINAYYNILKKQPKMSDYNARATAKYLYENEVPVGTYEQPQFRSR